MIGSCFSVEIGNKLLHLKYNVLQNPSGITFNPFSILTIVRACTLGVSLPKDDFFLHNDLWRHSDFHGSYNHPDKDTCIFNAQDSVDKAHTFISSITNVVITLGTAYVYEEKNSGHIVNNCHKRPSQDFNKRLLTTDEITRYLEESIKLIVEASEHKIQFILTISPVRHIKDGIIENQRSKARLIEATHRLQENYEEVSYFPAYELLLDDLRDYRFYGRDMVHPSNEAIDYIYDKFQSAYLSDSDRELRQQITQINNSLNHRPLFVNTDKHKSFVTQLIIRLEKVMSDYPHVSYDAEIEKLKNILRS
jgi:hypothetical protein